MSQTNNELRLVNKHWADISLTLNFTRQVASPSLRRAAAYASLKIPSGGYVDVVAYLGVAYDEACMVVKTSPEVSSLLRSGKLIIDTDVVAPAVVQTATPAPAATGPAALSYRALDRLLRDRGVQIPRNAAKVVLVKLAEALPRG